MFALPTRRLARLLKAVTCLVLLAAARVALVPSHNPRACFAFAVRWSVRIEMNRDELSVRSFECLLSFWCPIGDEPMEIHGNLMVCTDQDFWLRCFGHIRPRSIKKELQEMLQCVWLRLLLFSPKTLKNARFLIFYARKAMGHDETFRWNDAGLRFRSLWPVLWCSPCSHSLRGDRKKRSDETHGIGWYSVESHPRLLGQELLERHSHGKRPDSDWQNKYE